ncbi:MAG: hypothetical protein OXI27_01085 [Thaumarchaeota archaeon]|nr:hypothetical protein [Nitrososphaerota archaeon]
MGYDDSDYDLRQAIAGADVAESLIVAGSWTCRRAANDRVIPLQW